MTPGKFLRLIWPETGYYCIAHPFKLPDGKTAWFHRVFPTISEAVTHCLEQTHVRDVYFAVLSLREAAVWNPRKKNAKTGELGAYEYRTQTNMLSAKALFFDLDVGLDAQGNAIPSKYATQGDAGNDLLRFVKEAQLPMPTMISSGGGIHVYWHLETALPADEWGVIALNLRNLAGALNLKVDPSRTTDSASVLRVPKTLNWKDPQNPRPVETLQEGVVTPTDTLAKLISDALIRAGGVISTEPTLVNAAPLANPFGESNLTIQSFGPPPTLEEVATACGQVQQIILAHGDPNHPHYAQLDNNAWHKGFLCTIRHVEDGENWCRKLTAVWPRDNADIEAKLVQVSTIPPARCSTLREVMPWGDTPCQTCRFLNDPSVPNPLVAARKTIKAPPPVIQLVTPGAALQQVLIPQPPKPYERLKTGEVARTSKDKDGNITTEIIYAHDLYPVRRLVNDAESTEQQVWRVHLPRIGSKEFTIDADTLYDARKFCASMSHNGIYPNKANISYLQDYMVAYISQLQRDLDADAQSSHLGWSDNYQQFILPDKTLHADGSVRPSTLTKAATTATQFVTRAGDLQSQVNLFKFFNRPEYIPNQTVILDGLASILFHMTGHHGIVVNCSGDAGASKSTTMMTGISHWGDPVMLPINGTNRGATANGRMQRVASNANIPTGVDEITHMPTKEIQDLVMGVTQPGHRLRLQTDGSERKAAGGYKSAIMITTANTSLHNALSQDNAAGTAGSMRVFEIRFAAQRVHSKAEADEYLRQLKLHYGWTGEVFAAFVIQHRAAVEHRLHQVMREIDTEASITSAERFWSARIAVDIVAAEIARALHLLPYDEIAIRRWSVQQQIPYMRGIVKEEYRDALGVLTDYIATSHGNILVVEKSTAIGANTTGQSVVGETAYSLNNPGGALLGHYDKVAGVLYLLKQGFKDHCNRVGASSTRILEELYQPRTLANGGSQRIVTERAVRRTLGAGTNMAKGQSWCFAVDMQHPELSGATALATIQGGAAQPTPPAGHLRAV